MFANIKSRRFYFLFFLSIIFLILISPIASWAKWKLALPQFVLVQTSVDSEGLDANQLKEEADKLYQAGKYREALPLFDNLFGVKFLTANYTLCRACSKVFNVKTYF